MEVGSKKTEDGGQNVDLPPEIIDAILSRLPVKSLCRFKLVSKSWQSLISDLDFVANYSKAAIENKDVLFRRRRLLFTLNLMDSAPSEGMYSLDLDQFLNENPNAGVDGLVATPSELDFVYNHLPDGINWFPFALYSCPGLFLSHLWSGNFSVNLIDPLTKESKTIPEPPKWRLGFEIDWYLHGFGFDHSTNEYKVINGQTYDNIDGVMFSVYTLQIGSWRQIDCLFPYRFAHTHGILVNGAVHWLAVKVADGSLVIISFTLAEEEVRELALPPNTPTHPTPNTPTHAIVVGKFRDWLCITSRPRATSSSEFWVMRKYGVSESWTKMRVSIPYKELLHSSFWTQTHDLMVFDMSSLVMYNFNDDTYWTLSIGKVGRITSIGIYVETLPTLPHRSRTSSKEDDSDIIEH